MNKLILVLIVLAFAGCAVKSENLNLVPKLTEVEQRQIVSDMVKKLSELYPPAKTRLCLAESRDSFGAMLSHDLREQGYALQEQSPDKTDASSGLPVRYILDQTRDLYRVTITIGKDSISLPYSEQNGVLTPAGYWVHKEQGHE